AAIHVSESRGRRAALAAPGGRARDHAGAARQLARGGSGAGPIAEAQAGRDGVLVQNLKPMFGVDFPSGGWRQPPDGKSTPNIGFRFCTKTPSRPACASAIGPAPLPPRASCRAAPAWSRARPPGAASAARRPRDSLTWIAA
ncbi:hypothetical protein, partial [Bradyrhizobium elkanii]|uniref:hypothetical protein n=1 Tax=Bradyrhizobium elkanii TaxID=29448 RepID=UPI0005C1C6DC